MIRFFVPEFARETPFTIAVAPVPFTDRDTFAIYVRDRFPQLLTGYENMPLREVREVIESYRGECVICHQFAFDAKDAIPLCEKHVEEGKVPFCMSRQWNDYGTDCDYDDHDYILVDRIVEADRPNANRLGRYSGQATLIIDGEEKKFELHGNATLHGNGNGHGSWNWEEAQNE